MSAISEMKNVAVENSASENVAVREVVWNVSQKNIVILATGGTIAGAGELGKDVGYKSGSIEAQTLIDAIPELKNVANIFVEQVCNINSDDITSEIWIRLARRIKELSENGFGASHENVDGFVLMHGTDTMEETAFFLCLTLGGFASRGAGQSVDCASDVWKAAKPVVLTGSMRPATAAEPDGPANLLFAVKSAVEMSAENAAGVYIAFSGKLMNACSVQKIHANDLDAFDEVNGGGFGASVMPAFDISSLQKLPRVSVLYFNADADVELVHFAAERSAGLVIAGAGAGEFSQAWAVALSDAVSKSKIPVVISTRINRGCIGPEQLLVPGTIAAYDLPPAKAAVLLRLALTVTKDPQEIQKMLGSSCT